MKYGDGVQIRGNRDLEDCFAQANDQMDILDGLIREMRQMGQPCDMYQKRYCQGAGEGMWPISLWYLKSLPSLMLQDVSEISKVELNLFGDCQRGEGPCSNIFLTKFHTMVVPMKLESAYVFHSLYFFSTLF